MFTAWWLVIICTWMFPSLEPAFPAFEFKYRMQLFVSRSRAEWLAFPAGQIFFSPVHWRARRLNRFRGSGAIQARPSLIAVISEGVRISDASRFMQRVTFYPSGHLRSMLVIGPTDLGSGFVSGELGAVAKRPCSGRVRSSESSLGTAMLNVGRSV